MTKRISRLRFLIHNKTLLKTLLRHFKKTNYSNLQGVEFFNKEANNILNYKFDCSNPRSFNEHLCWIKANYRNEEWMRCADKLAVKSFLSEHGFEKYIVKTYKIYNNSSEINLDELPSIFILKTNHDSGSVFYCEKGKTNFEDIFKKLDKSISAKYSDNNGEWVYESIKPLIFAEECVRPRVGPFLVDYKFFAFNGLFGWGFTGQNRDVDTRFCVFERGYEIQNVEYIYLKPQKKYMPPKPALFEEMIDVSEQISKLLDFVRVDFYDTDQGPKIGELTFFSQAGYGPFTKKEFDFKYGNYFKRTRLYDLIG